MDLAQRHLLWQSAPQFAQMSEADKPLPCFSMQNQGELEATLVTLAGITSVHLPINTNYIPESQLCLCQTKGLLQNAVALSPDIPCLQAQTRH